MDLRTFIKTALLDIVSGIKDAQEQSDPGCIVPSSSISQNWVELGITKIQAIEFDVLVRAEEASGKEAKIGVVSGLFSAGVQGTSSSDTSHESRIKLRIPVQYPTSGGISG